jgi:hypothetical protein
MLLCYFGTKVHLSTKYEERMLKKFSTALKVRKLTWSKVLRRIFFFNFYGFCIFKFKETLFCVLQIFRVALLDRVALHSITVIP